MSSRNVYAVIMAVILISLPIAVFALTSLDQVFSEIEVQYRLPAGVLGKIANIESGGNPNARSSYSTAVGMFQWLESSWLYATKALYGTSLSLSSRTDPVTSAKVTAFALREILDRNGPLITQAKVDPTLGLYLGHFLGQAGSARFLAGYIQSPDSLASTVFTKEAQSNPSVFGGKTFAQILNNFAAKLKVAGVPVRVAGNFTDAMGISLAKSDADVGLNEYYPPGFVPTGSDPYRTFQTNYNTSATPAIAAGLSQWLTSTLLAPKTGSTQSSGTSGKTNTGSSGSSSSGGTSSSGSSNSSGGSTSSGSSDPTTSGTTTSAGNFLPPASIILSQASSLPRGGSTLVAWSSVGMTSGSCSLTQNGQAFATGNEGSKLLTAPITSVAGTISLALQCVTAAGVSTSKSIVITVQ